MQKFHASTYVLVVEDHPLVSDSLAACVHDCVASLEVCVAESLAAALRSVALRGAPLLVISDLSLTDTNGIEVVRGLRAAAPGSALLVVTALDDPALRSQVMESGALGYIVKSTGIQTIKDHIATALRGRAVGITASPVGAAGVDRLLTRAQIAVLVELAAGRSNKEIAARLGISDETVGSHMKEILGRLGVRNRTEAVVRYLQSAGGSRSVARR